MLRLIDISSWQADITRNVFENVDACIIKLTEGADYVNPYWATFADYCIKAGIPFGFYHFANDGDPIQEAMEFLQELQTFSGLDFTPVLVLDWEQDQSVDWVNRFVRKVHDETGIWPWIYANPWRFNQGGVEPNCMRWVASYPNVAHPTFEQAAEWECPECDGLVGAWQFCSDGRVGSYAGDLDCSIFYGDEKAFMAYGKYESCFEPDEGKSSVLENDEYKVTIERK